MYTTSEGKWIINCSGGKQQITCLDSDNATTYRRLNAGRSTLVRCIGQTDLVMHLSEQQMKLLVYILQETLSYLNRVVLRISLNVQRMTLYTI